MVIGVICPSVFEYRALDRAALQRRGAEVVQSGMGKLRAMHACAKLHHRHPSLRHILLVGFAGGLTAHLSIGAVVEPFLFIEQDYFAEPFEKFPNQIRRPHFKKLLSESIKAVMLTQDRFLKDNPYRRGPYAKKFKTIACDMESYAVAYYCKESAIPYSVIKLISDLANRAADHDFLKACRVLAPRLNQTVLNAVEKVSV